jgi:hypothetical protein
LIGQNTAMRWLTLGGAAVVLGAAGVFLAGKPLSEQDQYASIGSFVLAVLSLALAVLSQRADKHGGPTTDADRPDLDARGNTYLIVGDDRTVRVTQHLDPPRQKRRGARSKARITAHDNGVVASGNGGIFEITEDHEPKDVPTSDA